MCTAIMLLMNYVYHAIMFTCTAYLLLSYLYIFVYNIIADVLLLHLLKLPAYCDITLVEEEAGF